MINILVTIVCVGVGAGFIANEHFLAGGVIFALGWWFASMDADNVDGDKVS